MISVDPTFLHSCIQGSSRSTLNVGLSTIWAALQQGLEERSTQGTCASHWGVDDMFVIQPWQAFPAACAHWPCCMDCTILGATGVQECWQNEHEARQHIQNAGR